MAWAGSIMTAVPVLRFTDRRPQLPHAAARQASASRCDLPLLLRLQSWPGVQVVAVSHSYGEGHKCASFNSPGSQARLQQPTRGRIPKPCPPSRARLPGRFPGSQTNPGPQGWQGPSRYEPQALTSASVATSRTRFKEPCSTSLTPDRFVSGASVPRATQVCVRVALSACMLRTHLETRDRV